MKSKLVVILFNLFIVLSALSQSKTLENEIPKLNNPMSVEYLKANLLKSQPRLVLNSAIEKELKKKLNSDSVIKNMYAAIKLNASIIAEKPLLKRDLLGRRLLSVSREMLWRINMLGMVYRIEKDENILNRINEEIIAVCNFSDWNPSHYLDVAELALAVSIAIDWTAGALPKSTQKLAINALIEKGIKPSWPQDGKNQKWVYGTNNWNQVCHGGLIAASIVVADTNPELAAKTIHRALDALPKALKEFGPDGVYPEGSTYWTYGTGYSVTTIAMLESAFEHDFGYADYPGFMESAVFRLLMNTPTGRCYNFADCSEYRSKTGDNILAWFAAKTGSKVFFEKNRFLISPKEMGKLDRLSGLSLVWLSQFESKAETKIPTVWKGEGINPIVVFTNGENDSKGYYFGAKGGAGNGNHANMDGGSFIFELNGVRWVVDPGNQNYHALEKTGFDLWKRCQDCERWTLLTKNNFGHSTITVNNSLHRTDGLVTISDFEKGIKPNVTFNMSATLKDLVSSASRTFIKDSPTSIIIEDSIVKSNKTKLITWQLITTANIEIVDGGAMLSQDGKTLRLENISHPEFSVSVVSLYPAPLELDKQIKDLKRIEIRIPAWTIEKDTAKIKVRLSAI